MTIRSAMIIAFGTFMLLGCVSAEKHKRALSDIESLQSMLRQTNEEKRDLETQLKDLRNKYDTVSSSMSATAQDNSELKNELANRNMEIVKLQESIRLKDIKINDLEQEIEKISLEKIEAVEQKEQELSKLKNTYDDLTAELHDKIVQGEIEITQLKDKLTVKMVDKILFDSGSAEVKKEGRKVLSQVAEILKRVDDKQIVVEGHTDNVPISARLLDTFPSNWELSTARATNVVRYLQDVGGIDPSLLSAVGYGEHRPVASNETSKGKQKNRRIAIVLVPLEIVKESVEEVR